MGDTSEREFLEKIVNIKTKSSKKVNDIRNDFAKMQKLKAESLKKIEEMMHAAENDLEKVEQEIVKSKDVVPESRERLRVEIRDTQYQIRQKYDELKERILAALIPE